MLQLILDKKAHLSQNPNIATTWAKVMQDVNDHEVFTMNDSTYSPLLQKNVKSKFDRLEEAFRAKFLSQRINISGSEWSDEDEYMKRIVEEMDAMKEDKLHAKNASILKDARIKDAEIGLNLLNPSPVCSFTDSVSSTPSTKSSCKSARSTSSLDDESEIFMKSYNRGHEIRLARNLKRDLREAELDLKKESEMKESIFRDRRDYEFKIMELEIRKQELALASKKNRYN